VFIALIVIALTFPACSKTIDQTSDDATITAAVKTALLNDPQVGGMKIDVDTANAVVTLSGIVKSQPDAEHAMALARRAPGVMDVKSTLRVNPPA
jgi:hyperosmotically inducible protein